MALAWKAGWVHALTSSNLVSSASATRLATRENASPGLLRAALAEGVLPDHHPAAVLWWRISRHITPPSPPCLDSDHQARLTNWLPDLERLTAPDRVTALQHSGLWPPLVATIENALARRSGSCPTTGERASRAAR